VHVLGENEGWHKGHVGQVELNDTQKVRQLIDDFGVKEDHLGIKRDDQMVYDQG
jgi:hypothetical protein